MNMRVHFAKAGSAKLIGLVLLVVAIAAGVFLLGMNNYPKPVEISQELSAIKTKPTLAKHIKMPAGYFELDVPKDWQARWYTQHRYMSFRAPGNRGVAIVVAYQILKSPSVYKYHPRQTSANMALMKKLFPDHELSSFRPIEVGKMQGFEVVMTKGKLQKRHMELFFENRRTLLTLSCPPALDSEAKATLYAMAKSVKLNPCDTSVSFKKKSNK